MAPLVWDAIGERRYETGVDHGVLYLPDGNAVVWNGLTSVEETSDRELQSFYLEGVKYLQRQIFGDFSAKLKAFTYPEEFDQVNGLETIAPGLTYYDQPLQSFNLSYRTKIGNDTDGTDHGYKLHIVYNVMAAADSAGYRTLSDSVEPIEFSWSLSGTPPIGTGHRPTCHICIDSTRADPGILNTIEEMLYGSVDSDAHLPSFDELSSLISQFGALIIIDNGDGTWSAVDQSDQFITMISDTEFSIANVDSTYSDFTTYTVTTTIPE